MYRIQCRWIKKARHLRNQDKKEEYCATRNLDMSIAPLLSMEYIGKLIATRSKWQPEEK